MAEVNPKNEDDDRPLSREEEGAVRDRVCAAFLKGRSLVAHQIDSYNRFCDGLPALFRETEEFEIECKESKCNIKVRYGNACLKKPVEEAGAPQQDEADTKSLKEESEEQSSETSRPLMPWEARLRNLSYSAGLYADIILKVYSTAKETKHDLLHERVFQEVFLGKIPCMVKSKLCHYSGSEGTNVDCLYDLGAYFIVDGAEKVVISQEDRFIQRCTVSNKNCWKVFVTGRMTGLSTFMHMVIVNLQASEGGMLLYLKLPGTVNVPVMVVFRALGITTDRAVFELLGAVDDDELGELLRPSLTDAEAQMVSFLVSKGLPTDFRNMEMNLEYIGSKAKNTEETPAQAARKYLETRLFPQITSKRHKAHFLGYMVQYLCAVYMGRRSEDGGLKNKRIECVGEIFRDQLKSSMSRFRNELSKRMQVAKLPEGILSESFTFDKLIITRDFEAAFKRNSFRGGKFGNVQSGMVIFLKRWNSTETLSHLRHVKTKFAYSGKNFEARYPNKSEFGRICPVETPDSDNCGLLKTMAVFSVISSQHSEQDVIQQCTMFPLEDVPPRSIHLMDKIFINGRMIGLTDEAEAFHKRLVTMRRQGHIHAEVEVARNIHGEIHIFTDAGRLLRPLFILEGGHLLLSKNQEKELMSLTDEDKIKYLLKKGIVELLGPEEEERCVIAARAATESHTHMELHPAAILSVGASAVPFAGHNQSLRVTYQAQKQGKQAIGYYTSAPRIRCDKTSHQLFYPQKPLVPTRMMQLLERWEFMNGQNCIVAVACHSGYNQEDSLILNQASLDRGLFRSTRYTTYKYSIDPKKSSEQYGKPSISDIGGSRHQLMILEKLDSDGFPGIGERLHSKDVVIGKVCPSEGLYKDTSVVLKIFEEGSVKQVLLTSDTKGSKIGKVQLANVRAPQVGDKFSSLHGQKGVVGMCFNQEDLLFTQQGIVPDIVINPHAFPTRQTLGQLMETVAGKAAAASGRKISSNPFDEISPQELAEMLHRSTVSTMESTDVKSGLRV